MSDVRTGFVFEAAACFRGGEEEGGGLDGGIVVYCLKVMREVGRLVGENKNISLGGNRTVFVYTSNLE